MTRQLVSAVEVTDDGIHVVRLRRVFDASSLDEFEKVLAYLTAKRHYRIVVDLREIEFISSAGWGAFTAELRDIRDNHGDIRLAGMKPDVLEVFLLLELDSFLHAYKTVDEAIRSFNSPDVKTKDRKVAANRVLAAINHKSKATTGKEESRTEDFSYLEPEIESDIQQDAETETSSLNETTREDFDQKPVSDYEASHELDTNLTDEKTYDEPVSQNVSDYAQNDFTDESYYPDQPDYTHSPVSEADEFANEQSDIPQAEMGYDDDEYGSQAEPYDDETVALTDDEGYINDASQVEDEVVYEHSENYFADDTRHDDDEMPEDESDHYDSALAYDDRNNTTPEAYEDEYVYENDTDSSFEFDAQVEEHESDLSYAESDDRTEEINMNELSHHDHIAAASESKLYEEPSQNQESDHADVDTEEAMNSEMISMLPDATDESESQFDHPEALMDDRSASAHLEEQPQSGEIEKTNLPLENSNHDWSDFDEEISEFELQEINDPWLLDDIDSLPEEDVLDDNSWDDSTADIESLIADDSEALTIQAKNKSNQPETATHDEHDIEAMIASQLNDASDDHLDHEQEMPLAAAGMGTSNIFTEQHETGDSSWQNLSPFKNFGPPPPLTPPTSMETVTDPDEPLSDEGSDLREDSDDDIVKERFDDPVQRNHNRPAAEDQSQNEIRAVLLQIISEHPNYGPTMLKKRVQERTDPPILLSRSTVYRWLREEGLSTKAQRLEFAKKNGSRFE